MLYQFYETQRSIMEPFADLAEVASRMFRNPMLPLSQLPARIVWSDVVWVTATALILSVLAPVYPAWRAARVDRPDVH